MVAQNSSLKSDLMQDLLEQMLPMALYCSPTLVVEYEGMILECAQSFLGPVPGAEETTVE